MRSTTSGWTKWFLPVSLALAGNANAYYDSLAVTPAVPQAGQPFEMSFRVGMCDAVQALLPVAGPEWREFEVVDNVVRVSVRGANFSSSLNCDRPDIIHRFTMPPLQAGRYRLELRRRDITNPHCIPVPVPCVLTVATLDSTVTNGLVGSVNEVPATAPSINVLLAVGALLVGLVALRLRG